VNADAGPDQGPLNIGTIVNLNGNASIPFAVNETGTFSWAFLERPPDSEEVLESANTVGPRFSPDVAGDYIVELTYTVGLDSDTDTVTVTAE
jgi:hypothetical protein